MWRTPGSIPDPTLSALSLDFSPWSILKMLGLRILAHMVFNSDLVALRLFLSQTRVERFDGDTVFPGRRGRHAFRRLGWNVQ